MIKKIIINFWQPYTALYRYAELLSKLDNTEIVNVVDSRERWSYEHTGHDFPGKFKHGMFNTIMPSISHKDLAIYLNSLRDDNTVYHYTSQRDVILYNSDKILFTVHDNPFSQFNTNLYYNSDNYKKEKLRKLYEKYIFNKYAMHSNYITTNTNYVKESLITWGYKGKIYVINLPVADSFYHINEDKNKIRKELNLPLDKILILNVSNNVLRKNGEIIMKLNKILNDDYLIIGVGNSNGRINFKNINDQTLNKIYNACDALLFPSLEEGQGLPVIEAFKVGLPVIASDIKVLREVTNSNAIFVNPNDVNSIYQGIRDSIKNADEVIKNGRIEAKKYSFDIFKRKMEDLYAKISG